MYINTALIKEYLLEYFLTIFSVFLAGLVGGIFAYATSFFLGYDEGKWVAMWSMAFALVGFVLKEGSGE